MCSVWLALCDRIYTTYSFFWSRVALVNRRNASRSSLPSTIRWVIRIFRTRLTSPRRVLGGGISAARSTPTRLMRCASSSARNSMRSLRSITALANANEHNNGAATRGNARPHTSAPPHSAHFTGVRTTKEATPASRQPGHSSGLKCDTVAPLNGTMQK